MGWDVFISHASEDKPKFAVPLKQALERVGISAWIAEDRLHVSPVAAAVENDQFVSTSRGAEFGRVGTGRDADAFFVDKGSALGLSVRGGWGKSRDQNKNGKFPKWEAGL